MLSVFRWTLVYTHFILPVGFIWESIVSFGKVTFCLTSRYLILHSWLFHLKVLSFVWHHWMSYWKTNSFMWFYRLFYLKMPHFISYLHVLFENVVFDGFRLPYVCIPGNINYVLTQILYWTSLKQRHFCRTVMRYFTWHCFDGFLLLKVMV